MGSFSVFHWVIVVGICVAIWMGLRAMTNSGGQGTFCTTCGTVGDGKSKTSGSLLIEIVLWLCFIVPGVIYSLWRLTTRKRVCAACGATTLVPKDSPVAQKMRREMGSL